MDSWWTLYIFFLFPSRTKVLWLWDKRFGIGNVVWFQTLSSLAFYPSIPTGLNQASVSTNPGAHQHHPFGNTKPAISASLWLARQCSQLFTCADSLLHQNHTKSTVSLPIFQMEGTEAQRWNVAHPKSHGWQVTDLKLCSQAQSSCSQQFHSFPCYTHSNIPFP